MKNDKKIFILLWIIFAVILSLYNVFKLLSLTNPAIITESASVKMASQKIQQIEQANSIKIADIDLSKFYEKFNLTIEKIEQKIEPIKTMTMQTSVIEKNKKKETEIKLPDLTGILSTKNINGILNTMAIIEGKTFVENDNFNDFLICKISFEGVLFEKGEKKWFVHIKEVPFSINNGG